MSAPTAASTDAGLREWVERLAVIDAPSASPGERRRAELIADELRRAGWDARLEEERAHGTYWWPLGLMTALAVVAARAGGVLGAVGGIFGAAAVADDIGHVRRWFRRAFLPQRATVNVVAERGQGERTVVFVAHHDSAHAGLVFHPALPRAWGRRFPKLLERTNTTPGTLWGAFFGPLAVGVGSLFGAAWLRRLGAAVSAGYVAAMADIGLRRPVPGANDNLSGVAVVLALARRLAEPPPGVRVVLVSTGSEESFSEGMQAWGERHFPRLPRESTFFVAVDTVGSPHLLLLEGEGMLGIHEYPREFKDLVREQADELGVFVWKGLRFRNATDGVIPLRAGYPTVSLCSCDEFKAPTNYHWPTDLPENVDYETVADAARLCEAVARRLAR